MLLCVASTAAMVSSSQASEAQVQRDMLACKRIVRKYYFLGGARFHRDVEEVDPVCLEARGYSR